MTSTRRAIPAATGGMQLPARDRDVVGWETPEARPERGPTRSTSAGLGMGVTWPVSAKWRQGTADRVGGVHGELITRLTRRPFVGLRDRTVRTIGEMWRSRPSDAD